MKLVFFETTFCGGYEATEKCENDKVLGHVYLQPMSPPFVLGISKDLNYWELLSSFHQTLKVITVFKLTNEYNYLTTMHKRYIVTLFTFLSFLSLNAQQI